MIENQLIKYKNGQLEKVKYLIAITDKLLIEQLTQKELPSSHKINISIDEMETIQQTAKRVSAMTPEERKTRMMTPKEKEFYLQHKKENPETSYYRAWAKHVKETYQKTGERIY